MTGDNLGKIRPLKAMIERIAEAHGIEIGNFNVNVEDDSEEIFFSFVVSPEKFSKNEDQEKINDLFNEMVSDITPTVSQNFDMYEEFLSDDD